MRRSLVATGACIAMVMSIGLTFSDTASAQKKGKTRALTTHDLMEGLVKGHCGDLKKAIAAGDWKHARVHAALLNETGYILMADGRCPSKEWKQATETLENCSAVVLEKIEAKDAAGAESAFKAMTKSCAACHKAHKGK